MKNAKVVLSRIAHYNRVKSFRSSAALILTTLILVVAAGTTLANAQTYNDLYNFDGTNGRDPGGILAQGRDANLYGSTYYGGTSDWGVVFKITPSGTLTVLDDVARSNGLTLGTDGSFYGTTFWGTIFKITKSGSLTTLYSFDGVIEAPPIQGAGGNFYGATFDTGNTSVPGTAYKITPSGSFTSLGLLPGRSASPLLQGMDGNFYGTTGGGGSSNHGTVFKITPKGIARFYSFDGAHGSHPWGSLVQGADGNFYGTTYDGGSYDCGVVFRLTPQRAITVLHNFCDPNSHDDGSTPYAGLLQATDGNFYGVTVAGGHKSTGVIFQIASAGSYSILFNFDITHGAQPWSVPMQHTNGKIYGLANYGGTSGDGVVYDFDMGLGPFVTLVSTTGKVGKTIEVLGQGFTGTTAVSFNGAAATFTVVSDTYLTAAVPSGMTAGFVTVTTPSGTLKSNKQFRVKP